MSNDEKDIISLIKDGSPEELAELASKIRSDMISYVSKTGGHLASSLGVIELTIALHRVFDSPKDKIIFDVGHQCYAHKMITGRWEQMSTLRQMDGLSGFPKRAESPHDITDPGHSGTSLSILHGLASARDLEGGDYSCVAVIGDGSMTSGVAWEALNSIGASKTPVIVVLNDNDMSISKNVGGLNVHFQKLRTSGFYNKFKENLKKMNSPKGQQRLENIRDALKYSLLPRDIFEEIGFKYYGPIDGHDIESMCDLLSFAKTQNRPVMLHVITKKGKGFAPAEEDPTRFHGIGKFDPESCGKCSTEGPLSWSDAFGKALLKLAQEDERICAITAAMLDSTGLKPMQDAFPQRVFDVGIAEQHAAAFAEGLALNGMKPVAAVYSTFLQRAYDQMLTEICLQQLPVIFAVDRAGVTGPDGKTHQGTFDISFLSSMPGMTLMNPRDEATLENMLRKAFELGKPAAIRYPRGAVRECSFAAGDGTPQILKEGSDLIIISDANMLDEALNASLILENKYVCNWKPVTAAVADIGTLCPLQESFIADCLRRYKTVITLEDGVVKGGFGSAVCSFAEGIKASSDVLAVGWPDEFIEQGSIAQLREKYGMDAAGIAARISDYIGGEELEKKA